MPSLVERLRALTAHWYPGALPEDFAKAVHSYRYVTPSSSLLERMFLHAFWDRIVRVLPTTVAPNVLTLAGGAACLAMYVIDWVASPEATGTATPKWLYLLFAFLFFAYETLDGLDGKQARRTKSGSALGELMDHGVDAVSTGLVALISADAFGFGLDAPVTWISVFGSQMAFYTSNVRLLHRGSQKFLPIDIIELQWALRFSWIVTGLVGVQVWREVLVPVPTSVFAAFDPFGRTVFGLPAGPRPGAVELRFVMAFLGVGGTVANFFLYTLGAMPPYFAQKRSQAYAPGLGLEQLSLQFLSVSLYGVLAFVAVRSFASIPDAATRHDALRALLLGSCFAFGDQVNRLLLMRVAHHRAPFVSPGLILMAIFALGSLVNVDVRWWWGAAIACLVVHQTFSVWIARTLAAVLGIRPLTIRPLEGRDVV